MMVREPDSEATWPCPRCTAPRDVMATYCAQCGLALRTAAAGQPDVRPQARVAVKPGSSGRTNRGRPRLDHTRCGDCGCRSTAFLGPGSLAPRHTVSGTLLLRNGITEIVIAHTGSECHGISGYRDIVRGAQVTLRDGAGTILATSVLDYGSGASSSLVCSFTFTILDVAEVPFYSVEDLPPRPQFTEVPRGHERQ